MGAGRAVVSFMGWLPRSAVRGGPPGPVGPGGGAGDSAADALAVDGLGEAAPAVPAADDSVVLAGVAASCGFVAGDPLGAVGVGGVLGHGWLLGGFGRGGRALVGWGGGSLLCFQSAALRTK